MTELDIICLPKDLPEFIEVDLSELDAGHSLHVSGAQAAAGRDARVARQVDPVVATAVVPKAHRRDRGGRGGGGRRRGGRGGRSRCRGREGGRSQAREGRGEGRRQEGRRQGRQEEVSSSALRAIEARRATHRRRAFSLRVTSIAMTPIRLVAGLGNPGPRDTQRTRHNAGFWFADALAREARRLVRAGVAASAATSRKAGDVRIVKPTTYMNESGRVGRARSRASSRSRPTRSWSCTTSSTCSPARRR